MRGRVLFGSLFAAHKVSCTPGPSNPAPQPQPRQPPVPRMLLSATGLTPPPRALTSVMEPMLREGREVSVMVETQAP